MASTRFHFLHWNCHGLRTKWIEFLHLVKTTRPDFCSVNETRFPPESPFSLSHYQGFSVWGAGQWGTTVYVRRRLACQLLYRSGRADPLEVIKLRVLCQG